METIMRTKQTRPFALAIASDRQTPALDRQMLASWAVTAVAVILVLLFNAARGFSQEANQKTFPSADAAVEALAAAARTQDEPSLQAILGASGETIDSEDEATSRRDRETFVQKYDQMHRLVQEADGSTVLYIGAENWPFPFPIAHKGDVWFFDADAGVEEMLFRTVGENELTAIELCEQLVSAANAAADTVTASSVAASDGSDRTARSAAASGKAASRAASVTASDADKTGKMRAHARRVRALAQNAKGRTPRAKPDAFYGYYFEVIDPAAADAKAGEAFAFVAYPVDYRSSGVKTFVVTQDGVVYEKDLGPETTSLARKITPRATRSGWSRPAGK
jgi:hypothetical protein